MMISGPQSKMSCGGKLASFLAFGIALDEVVATQHLRGTKLAITPGEDLPFDSVQSSGPALLEIQESPCCRSPCKDSQNTVGNAALEAEKQKALEAQRRATQSAEAKANEQLQQVLNANLVVPIQKAGAVELNPQIFEMAEFLQTDDGRCLHVKKAEWQHAPDAPLKGWFQSRNTFMAFIDYEITDFEPYDSLEYNLKPFQLTYIGGGLREDLRAGKPDEPYYWGEGLQVEVFDGEVYKSKAFVTKECHELIPRTADLPKKNALRQVKKGEAAVASPAYDKQGPWKQRQITLAERAAAKAAEPAAPAGSRDADKDAANLPKANEAKLAAVGGP